MYNDHWSYLHRRNSLNYFFVTSKLEFYRDEIDRIEQEHIEVTRATRIRLEQDNQALEIELQKVKTNTTLNSEKLDYNFQVLKKREDENLMVRNAQKRRLTKLNETIFVLRRKIKDVQMNCLIETEKLSSDIMKLRFNISHMNTKVNTFAEVNDKKYHSVWQMNKNECSDVLKSILEIDKMLVEQHLGLKWEGPSLPDDHAHKLPEKMGSFGSDSTLVHSQGIKNVFVIFAICVMMLIFSEHFINDFRRQKRTYANVTYFANCTEAGWISRRQNCYQVD